MPRARRIVTSRPDHRPDTLKRSSPRTQPHTQQSYRQSQKGQRREADARDRLIPLVYAKLRRSAGAYFRDEPTCHTLQPTALVNEAYIRIIRSPECGWKTHTQFVRLACCVMRQTLIDHARRRRAAIRGGSRQRVALNEEMPGPRTPGPQAFLDLNAALAKLQAMDRRRSRAVELRYFCGLTVEETAEELGISPRTVKSDWNLARRGYGAKRARTLSMLAQRWKRVGQLFDQILKLPEAEWSRHLDSECASDPELRCEVERRPTRRVCPAVRSSAGRQQLVMFNG